MRQIKSSCTVNLKLDAVHISPVFFNIIKNNDKPVTINPSQHTSYLQIADVSTGEISSVINNNRNNSNHRAIARKIQSDF